jgi:hypothetical protein
MERLTEKERSPYIRTLAIWEERRVYSNTFIGKLRNHWNQNHGNHRSEKPGESGHKPMTMIFEDKKRLLNGDPKLVEVPIILERLKMQLSVTDRCIECIKNADDHMKRPLNALLTSLTTESMVR